MVVPARPLVRTSRMRAHVSLCVSGSVCVCVCIISWRAKRKKQALSTKHFHFYNFPKFQRKYEDLFVATSYNPPGNSNIVFIQVSVHFPFIYSAFLCIVNVVTQICAFYGFALACFLIFTAGQWVNAIFNPTYIPRTQGELTNKNLKPENDTFRQTTETKAEE